MDKILNNIVKLQNKYPTLYVGGSLSLILQEAIPYRNPKDVDLITPYEIHVYDLFEVKDKEKDQKIKIHKHNEIMWELFHNPNAQYVNYIYKGYNIKLSPIEEVIQWKFTHLRDKHINDIKQYLLESNK